MASIPGETLSKIADRAGGGQGSIPVTLLGRLAVDVGSKGQGLGSKILIDALKRSLKVAEIELGSVAVITDPLDQEAESYYDHFGFIKLPNSGKMFLDMNTINC